MSAVAQFKQDIIGFLFNAAAFSPALPANYSVALWNGDPGDTGATGTEVTGTLGLARQNIARSSGGWNAASAAATAEVTNASAVAFGDATGPGSADYFALFNGTTLIWKDLLRDSGGTPESKSFNTDDAVRIGAGSMALRLSGFVNAFNATLLNYLFRDDTITLAISYAIALYSSAPAADGTGGTEITGTAGLTRQLLTRNTTDFAAADATGLTSNNVAVNFGTLTAAATASHYQVFSSVTPLLNGAWDTAQVGAIDDDFQIDVGALTLALD